MLVPFKGRVTLPKRMDFRKVPKGVGGVIFTPDFGPLNRASFERKKLQHVIPKRMGGGGSKAVWNFSENSSVLVASPVPITEITLLHRQCF